VAPKGSRVDRDTNVGIGPLKHESKSSLNHVESALPLPACGER